MSEGAKPSQISPSSRQAGDLHPEDDMSLAAIYRREALRLLDLASRSPFAEVKHDFLRLALNYEALAEHAALRGWG